MAVPVYGTDLVDVTLAESITGWVALGGGASGLAAGADFAMQGTNCVDKQITGAEKGQVFGAGAGITFGAADHVFVWVFLATPGVSNSLLLRGLAIVIGTLTTAYNTFHVAGNDTYGASGKVGRCYPIRYLTTANTVAPNYRTLTGAPGAAPLYFGATANITGTVKGANLGVDAIRYGTGMYITAGDATTPASLVGAAAQNDTVANRWGVLSYSGGVYELQGKLVIGQDNTKTATAAYFVAADALIMIVDTPHSLTDFTQIILDHASTVCNLTGVTIKALGTNNPGQLICNNAATASAITNGTFVGIGITVLRAAVVVNGSIWTGCGLVTPNGATLGACTFSSTTAANALTFATTAESDSATNCIFKNNVRAIKITAIGTYTFDAHIFSGNTYDIENSSAGLVTINCLNGSHPTTSINTGGGSVVINYVRTLTLTGLKVGTEVRIILHGTQTELAGEESNTTGSFAYTYSFVAGVYVDIIIFHTEYSYPWLENYLLTDASVSLPIQQSGDRQYSNPV